MSLLVVGRLARSCERSASFDEAFRRRILFLGINRGRSHGELAFTYVYSMAFEEGVNFSVRNVE